MIPLISFTPDLNETRTLTFERSAWCSLVLRLTCHRLRKSVANAVLKHRILLIVAETYDHKKIFSIFPFRLLIHFLIYGSCGEHICELISRTLSGKEIIFSFQHTIAACKSHIQIPSMSPNDWLLFYCTCILNCALSVAAACPSVAFLLFRMIKHSI